MVSYAWRKKTSYSFILKYRDEAFSAAWDEIVMEETRQEFTNSACFKVDSEIPEKSRFTFLNYGFEYSGSFMFWEAFFSPFLYLSLPIKIQA